MVVKNSNSMPSSVAQNLNENSKFDIAVDRQGLVYLFYTNDLAFKPSYVEYDSEMRSLSFVSEQGHIQNCGIKVKNTSQSYLMNIDFIILVKVNEKFSMNGHKKVTLIKR